MPVPFACPHCGEQTLVDEKYSGQCGPCIGCGKLIVVPHFASSSAPRADAASPRPPRTFLGMSPGVLLIVLAGTAAAAGMLTVVALLAVPLVEAATVQKNRRVCSANLRQIGAALLQYEREHGALPPAEVKDASGMPLYSWRVLILPYLGPQEKLLYEQFRLDEPWSSPSNSQLLRQMPAVFRSPGDTAAKPEETSYVVIAGQSTAFPPRGSFSTGQIGDGPYTTLLVVEMAGSNIAWTEPRDLLDSQLSFQIGVDIGGNHEGGMNALFADGNVRFLSDALSSEEVADLATANGREQSRTLETDY